MPEGRGILVAILITVALASPAGAADVGFSRRGLTLDFEDVPLSLRLGGRFHLDGAFFDEDLTSMDDDWKVRRGRVYLSGKLFHDWRFKAEYEFAGNDGWRNLWLEYRLGSKHAFRVGNLVAPVGLEDVAASNHATFMERALAASIAPSYGTGVRVRTRGTLKHAYGRARWTASAAGFIEPLGKRHDDRHGSEHYAFATRLTFAPFSRSRRLLHFAGSFEYRDVRSGSGYRISSRPESSLAPRLFSTGSLADVDQVFSFGAEAASVVGPFSVQAEYMRAMLQRGQGRSDPDFYGWYVQGSWIVTGENRRYSRNGGTFVGVRPKHRFGAVELAVRYGGLDLQDGGIHGGKGEDLTAGVNWYLLRNIRLMFNYVHVDSKQRLTGLDDDPEVFEGRFMLFF
jgi:phosphate-selective porin OprO/OprP